MGFQHNSLLENPISIRLVALERGLREEQIIKQEFFHTRCARAPKVTLERPKLTLEHRRALGTSEVGRTDMERG